MKGSLKSCYQTQLKIKTLYAVGIIFVIVSTAFGIAVGSTALSLAELFDGLDTVSGRILLYVRLPRALGSLVCGMALSLSGAVIQAVLVNKLAGPSIIGVNSGAGLAVAISAALGIYGGFRLSLIAFIGAFVATMLLNFGVQKWKMGRGSVVLVGVALNCLFNALTDVVTTLLPDIRIITGDFKIGELQGVTYSKLIPASVVVTVSLVILMTLRNELGVLSLGEDNARGLGMNTSRMRCVFLILSALLAGSAVSIAGLVSFVGLIVPHAVRRVSGNHPRHLLPLCALYGGGFVCLCDTLSRVLFSPYEIPVGIIMAFLGVPFFILLLVRGRRSDYAGD